MAIFVPNNRAGELRKKAFESSSKIIKKVFQSTLEQGHRLPSRGQGGIFKVTAHRRHGSTCNGGFGRCESKKAGLRVNKI